MHKTYLVAIFVICLAASARAATNTNWGGAVEVEAVPSAWNYVKTPGWYFWSGAGVSFGVGVTGMILRFLRRIDMNDPLAGGGD